jgi:transposase-like protein
MNIIEIANIYPNELSVIKHFEKVRWGKKPKCAYCGSINVGERNKDFRFHCMNCGRSFSVTTNTQLHNTKLPLKTWLYSFAIVTDAKKGVSAKQLERNIGVHYEIAWTIGHKIRSLMEIENSEIELSGILEMDETYVGGKPRKFNDGTTSDVRTAYKIPELDAKIKELKEAGIKLKRGRGNPAKSDVNPKRGRGTEKIPVAGIVQRNGNVVA